jgi:hypothetical protein
MKKENIFYGNIIITTENQKEINKLLKTVTKITGSIYLSENAKAEFPVLTTSGNIDLRENAKAEFPVLTTSGYIYLRENAKAEFPVLTTSSYIYLRENAKAEFPVLTTSSYIYLRENAKIIHPKIKKLNYKSFDNSMFVIESEKTSKEIRIYSGYIFLKFDKKEIIKKVCFVAEKEKFSAHGETIKKAIQDLNFKIISEKLKNKPIKKDTIITPEFYHIVTGSCMLGIESWMRQHNMAVESIKAVDLLPILEKTNAYGIDRFKSLITF